MGLIILIFILAVVYLVILYLNGTFSKGGRNPPEDELMRADTKAPAPPKEAPKTETKPEPAVIAPSDAVAVPKEAPVTTVNYP